MTETGRSIARDADELGAGTQLLDGQVDGNNNAQKHSSYLRMAPWVRMREVSSLVCVARESRAYNEFFGRQ